MAPSSDVFIAKESGATQVGDEVYTFTKGITRLRGDHPLLDAVPDYFEPIDAHLHYEEPHVASVEAPPADEPLLHDNPEKGDEDSLDEEAVAAVLEGNVGQVAEFVASCDSAEMLTALAEAETEGKDRQGVHDAIEARMYTLQAEGDMPPNSGTTAGDGTGDREV